MKMKELVDFELIDFWECDGYMVECDIDECVEVAKNVLCFGDDVDDVYHLCKNHGHEYLRETEGKPTSFIVNRDGLYATEQQFEETDIPF